MPQTPQLEKLGHTHRSFGQAQLTPKMNPPFPNPGYGPEWAGHVEWMADDILPMRGAVLREQGRRRRARPSLRWEDCIKTYVRKSGEKEDWQKKTRYI